MPPKQRFSRDDIIDAAFSIVRRQGWEGLSARSIAKELNASTRPIYGSFESMEHIEIEVVKKALAFFVSFLKEERTGDKWLDQAMGYVLFAAQEKHLFRCINDEKHIQYQREFAPMHWKSLGEMLADDERFSDLSDEAKDRIRIARWFFLHGVSSLLNSGWFELPDGEEDFFSKQTRFGTIIDFLKRANDAFYKGFKG